ncbi:mechanosensitive ion channel family protein [Hyalangium sp.]|uniref:mechanosensitive ion channel family protein n=1 Tax=Hyalangium sp. TaxID=2028555 RepID=UPI002D483F35|nr:mechanosensitive ion channel domain-containing protein [Hyalangium sp.]HYH99441.1 mechanosensitive ion channel domain-containing protein [Hyalangium sp.]
MRRSVTLALLLSSLPALALNEGLGAVPLEVDRRTPASTVEGFIAAAHARDDSRAPHYLFLSHLPAGQQVSEGPQLARRLMFVLDRELWLDFSRISHQPEGDPADPHYDTLGQVTLKKGSRSIRLQRVETPEGAVWVFSEDTVRAVELLFSEHGSPLLESLPPFLFTRPIWVLELWQWLGLALVVVVCALAARSVEGLALRMGARATGLTKLGWDDQVMAAGRGPLRYLGFVLLVAAAGRLLLLPPPAQRLVDVGARSVVIVTVAWFLLRFVRLAALFVEQKVAHETSGEDVGRARGIRTQLAVLRRVIDVAVVLVAASLLLLQFEAVRSVGVSLLASAGLAGLVIGLAAQKSISTLLAGIQLSITQPVRIGDTVIVENEWGWIEEITLTYVVVKVWDLRRLVVPMSHFLDKPFQNWSKVSPEILGTVEVYADFRTDVAAVRAELKRILEQESEGLWDGKVQGLQVTGCSERTMLLRALVSATDAGKAWDLRCLVREKLMVWLQRQPQGLPLMRAEASHQLVGEPTLLLGVPATLGGRPGGNVLVSTPKE